jgi:hypothetical protein
VEITPVFLTINSNRNLTNLLARQAIAAIKLQRAFRAKRAKQLAQRYRKVITRKLTIRSTDPSNQAGGAVLGELIVRCVWKQTDPEQLVHLDKGEGFEAQPDGLSLLQSQGASKNAAWHRHYYESDPNYLMGDTVFKPPPIKRLMHVYGTGMSTHWSFIYRSLHGVEIKEDGPRSLGIELDPTADHLGDQNYKLKDGELFETKHTLQRLPDNPDKTVRTSGDGTVPYQSLRFSKTWDSPSFLSQVVELTGKEHEHREILASKQFHNVLTGYLTETVVVYIVEARDLQPFDVGGASDPYCELYARGPTVKRTLATRKVTKTVFASLQPTFNERFEFGTVFVETPGHFDGKNGEITPVFYDFYGALTRQLLV